jgi:hypothetical protein
VAVAWKELERRVCRALGGDRRPGIQGDVSDCTDRVPYAVEVKRVKRFCLRDKWIEQARRHSRLDGKPWLLVQARHGSPRLVASLDFQVLVNLTERAGLIGKGDLGKQLTIEEVLLELEAEGAA